jgi:3-oxoacyl-[acyl-carrier-protein] synthase II
VTGNKHVVVTGIGVVSCCGIGAGNFFEGLFKEAPIGIREIKDYDPTASFDPKEQRRTDRFVQFATTACIEALSQAGVDPTKKLSESLYGDPRRWGTLIGTGVGGIATLETQILVNHDKGPRRVSPFLVPMMMPNSASATVSMRWGLEGPCQAITTACAAGTHSIGEAFDWIRTGRCDLVITGGSEAALTPTAIAAFTNMTALSGSGISRPFDKQRDGFVIAEGAAIAILESESHALSRGAKPLAQILGYGSTADAYHITAPSPNGQGAINCMQQALDSAGLKPDDVVHINAHGTSTPLNDLAEAQAISAVFGSCDIPVTSIKGVTGHALGAAGALEAAACVLCLDKKILPPTAGLKELDDEIKINVIEKATSFNPGPILSNSFGFGGHNASIVIGPA